jgi:hypothetical protein
MFFAVIIQMCLVRESSTQDYWNGKKIMRTIYPKSIGYPYIAAFE